MQTIYNFLSADRCQDLIKLTEKHIRDDGNYQSTGEKLPDYYIFDDEKLAAELWTKLKDEYKLLDKYVLENGDEYTASGVGKKMNILRYKPGYAMGKHCDYPYDLGYNITNPVTLVIYLNTVDPQHGGITLFTNEPDMKIASEQGKAFLFVTYDKEHQVTTLKHGYRYSLVTNVIYTLHRCKDQVLLEKIYTLNKELENLFDKENCDIGQIESKSKELSKLQYSYEKMKHK